MANIFSLDYTLLCLVVLAGTLLLPIRWRWTVLLTGSVIAYSRQGMAPGLIIVVESLIAYFSALLMIKCPRGKKQILVAHVMVAIGSLITMKYSGLIVDTIWQSGPLKVKNLPAPAVPWLAPLGISFYTLMSIAYVSDVYSEVSSPERNPLKVLLGLCFFPIVTAGPIERLSSLIPQLSAPKIMTYERFRRGALFLLWGFFKKMVIADRIGIVVNTVYADPAACEPILKVIAAILFVVQIYCDFSAYSDMAVGMGRLLGVDLIINFNTPYFSRTVKEYWQRNHISLSTWVRDYLFVPLVARRMSLARISWALMLVFGVSGIWHGASWTFLAWGLLHGIYLVRDTINERRWKSRPAHSHWIERLRVAKERIIALLLICISLIFFRAASFNDAMEILRGFYQAAVALPQIADAAYLRAVIGSTGLDRLGWLIGMSGIAVWLGVEAALQRRDAVESFYARSPVLRWMAYYTLLLAGLLLGTFNQTQGFIYQQF